MNLQISFRPLTRWPKQPTRNRQRSRFDSKHRDTMELLDRELSHLNARNIVIEADCDSSEIRRDGMLRSDAKLRGPGIVVRFESKKESLCFPCDTFTDWQDNLRAIAKALEALRMVDRYGVTSSGEQYRGWTALPDKSQESIFKSPEDAAAWIAAKIDVGLPPLPWSDGHKQFVRTSAIKLCHPDRNGGNDAAWKLWQQAAAMIGISI